MRDESSLLPDREKDEKKVLGEGEYKKCEVV